MVICLVNPYSPALSWFFYSQGMSSPPLGMCQAATELREVGHEVIVLDGQADYTPPDKTLEQIKKLKPDLVAIMTQPFLHLYTYMTTSSFPYHVQFAEKVKQMIGKTIVVLGGVYPSFYPEEVVKRYRCIDFVLTHPGASLAALAKAITKDYSMASVRGIAWRKSDGEVRITKWPQISDSFASSSRWLEPAYDLLEGYPHKYGIDRYLYLAQEREIKPIQPVIGALGCPYSCSFCATPAFFRGKNTRTAPEQIVQEIARLCEQYKVDAFSLWDDTLTSSAQYVRKICEGIIQANLCIRWWCFGRTNWILKNRSNLKLMHRAGCRMIWLGIESTRSSDLKIYNKQESFEKGLEAVHILKKYGIASTTSFIIGNAYDTEESIMQLVEDSQRFYDIGSVNVYTILVPIPGTPLHKELDKKGFIYTNDLRLYSGTRAVIDYPYVKRKRVESIFYDVYKKSILGDRYINHIGRTNFWDENAAPSESSVKEYNSILLEGFDREVARIQQLERTHYL